MLAAVALVAAALFLIPIPYIIFGPGAAVDLTKAVVVPRHASPQSRFYLTDVDLFPGRPAFYALAKVLPGFEIIRRRELVPPTVSDKQLNVELVDAMTQSQMNAQIVAERAAGLPVKASSSFTVVQTIPGSPGARCFRPGDSIRSVNGRTLSATDTLAGVTMSKPAGTVFALSLERNGRRLTLRCETFRYRGKPHFGITGRFATEVYSLPVHVTFRVPNINGSSAGLMFALQIYRTLVGRDVSQGRNVAGTGVLNADGTVDPIEGGREKVQAAVRAGAEIFIVPVANYRQIKDTPRIRVIPVRSFSGALTALQKSR